MKFYAKKEGEDVEKDNDDERNEINKQDSKQKHNNTNNVIAKKTRTRALRTLFYEYTSFPFQSFISLVY